jgi:hypothetical protein
LPAGYVTQHVELLYATTTHRAQGATVDSAHMVITAGMTRENLYVLASRAREKTTFYVATHDLPFDEDPRVDQARTDPHAYAAREILLRIIATEGAPVSATETITTAQDEAGSLATLVPRYLHAARQDAGRRYEAAALAAPGDSYGRDVIADPAWTAVVSRLYDAESDGWDPTRLLAVVAAQRELESADSVAEVLAWRIDGYLATNPDPPSGDRPYEPAPDVRERLSDIAATTLGTRLAGRAQAERAWPALIAALRRAEATGHEPVELLSSVANARELATARSVSEVLAWRIGRHLAAHPGPRGGQTANSAPAGGPLPWLPSARTAPETSYGIARYLSDACDLITARTDTLGAAAARQRPPWMLPLGLPPEDPAAEAQWLRHVVIVAAYRDQYKVTSDDPRQVLGPYVEAGQEGYKAYWLAAGSVLAARRLAGLELEPRAAIPDARARSQLAADIYRALPDDERGQVSADMQTKLGPFWFGNRAGPDQDAATQRAHAATLVATLIKRGHLTAAQPATIIIEEPLEVDLVLRCPTRNSRRASIQAPGGPQRSPRPELRPRPDQTRAQTPQHRPS